MSLRLILFIGAVLAAAGWWTLRVEWAERRRLRRLARQLGAEFTVRDRRNLRHRHRELALWQFGHAHELSRIMHGRVGTIDFVALSDSYEVGFGRDWRRQTYLLVVLRVDVLLPDVVLARGVPFAPVGPHTGYREVVSGRRDDWRLFSARGENPERLWPAVREATAGLAGPTLVETQRAWIAIGRQVPPRPESYEQLIRAGTALVRGLGLLSRDETAERS